MRMDWSIILAEPTNWLRNWIHHVESVVERLLDDSAKWFPAEPDDHGMYGDDHEGGDDMWWQHHRQRSNSSFLHVDGRV